MLRVALLGPPGAGKSEVARCFAADGVRVLEADRIAHALYEPGGPAYQPLIQALGEAILSEDGTVDRKAVRRILGEDPDALRRLNEAVHPALITALRDRMADFAAEGAPVVVVDAALLLEWGMADDFDVRVGVFAPEASRRRWMAEKRGWSDADFDRIAGAQLGDDRKRAAADWIIENDGSLDDLRHKAAAVWSRIAEGKDMRQGSDSRSRPAQEERGGVSRSQTEDHQ